MTIIDWMSKNVPDSVLSVLRPFYNGARTLKTAIYGTADSLRLIGPDSIYSDNYYAKRQNDPYRTDSRSVANALLQQFDPNSVIDFGCAIGAHLERFYEEDIEIRGVEGNPEAFEYAVIPEEFLESHDLRDPYNPERVYDLVLCFEVAEHLPERFAGTLVDTLSKSGYIVVMTAAPPGQEGKHHVNKQSKEYWREKFEARGMEYDEQCVAELRELIEVKRATWIPNNLMVFR
jgi:SAM-dependent methyltransferase